VVAKSGIDLNSPSHHNLHNPSWAMECSTSLSKRAECGIAVPMDAYALGFRCIKCYLPCLLQIPSGSAWSLGQPGHFAAILAERRTGYSERLHLGQLRMNQSHNSGPHQSRGETWSAG